MGNNFDYTTHKPRMPQFRESDGRVDWMQIADTFLPGDWWNSQTNQLKPFGIASGVTGLPIEGAVSFGRGLGNAARSGANFLRGIGRGREDRRNLGPTLPSTAGFDGGFAGQDIWGTQNPNAVRFGGNFADQDMFGTRDPNAVADLSQGPVPGFRMQGVPQNSRPQPMRGGEGGYNGRSISLARGLGESQRRTGESVMAEHMAFLENMRNRNGALMER